MYYSCSWRRDGDAYSLCSPVWLVNNISYQAKLTLFLPGCFFHNKLTHHTPQEQNLKNEIMSQEQSHKYNLEVF